MMELTRRGMNRQEAHGIIRNASLEALEKRCPLKDILRENPAVSAILSAEETAALLRPEAYIGLAAEQVQAVIQKLR